MKSVGCCSDKRIPPPPIGGPPPFSREAYILLANAVQNKVTRLHKQHLKEPTLQIQARATTGVGKPQAGSESNERIPPDGFGVAALESTLYG